MFCLAAAGGSCPFCSSRLQFQHNASLMTPAQLKAKFCSRLAEPFTGEAIFDSLTDAVCFIKKSRCEYVLVHFEYMRRMVGRLYLIGGKPRNQFLQQSTMTDLAHECRTGNPGRPAGRKACSTGRYRAALALFQVFVLCGAGAARAQADSTGKGAVLSDTHANPEQASPQQQQQRQRRARGAGRTGGVYRSQVTPHWFAENTCFWYRNDLSGGAREFILVDAARGTRERAFDHELVAKQIGGSGDGARLPVEELKFNPDGLTVTLLGHSNSLVLDLKSGKLQQAEGETAAVSAEGLLAELEARPSART